jgi:hypothetical protein
MLQKVISQACPSLLRLSQQLQGVVYYSVQIVVPALGDSISDGEPTVVHCAGHTCCPGLTGTHGSPQAVDAALRRIK